MNENRFLKNNPKENKGNSELKETVIRSLNSIQRTGLFSKEYMENITLIFLDEKEFYKFKNQEVERVPKDQFDEQDFMQGKRTDFVGIYSKNEFEKIMDSAIKNTQALEIVFMNGGRLTYDEFIAHEMAHNVFDIQYIKKFGEYMTKGNVTDVSDKYREKIKNLVIPLVKKYYPNIKVENYPFKRQQIAEIFAMLYEREFCRRDNSNMKLHEGMAERIAKFFKNAKKSLKDFNRDNGKNFTMEYVYEENHILSLIAAPLLEKEYPDFNSRLELFSI